jgi:hypothetical protein
MDINERELMKIRDMTGKLYELSKYVIYKDKDKYKKNKKILKKMINAIDSTDMEDAIDEISE